MAQTRRNFVAALVSSVAIVAAVSGAVAQHDSKWQEAQPATVAPGDVAWPSFNGREDGVRYSPLGDITPDNVGRLNEVCRVRVSGPGPFSSGPIVIDGVMYLTAQNATMAIDPTNCAIKWKSIFVPDRPTVLAGNRGAAFVDGLIVRGTSDGHLVAYDAASGQQKWSVLAGDSAVGEFISSAPIAWKGHVFVGLAGGDWGIQGKMMAFDGKTGAKQWSFNTIPGPGEKGHESWSGDAWKHGGGGVWTSYTLDPQTGELFVPVANPGPDFSGDARPGDNLFSDSVLVLDAATGRYLWHYQTLPHDMHDYGVTAPPTLVTLEGGRQIVVAPSKDGFVYGIDRKTHRLLYKTAVTTIENHNVQATEAGVHICPGIFGGVEWNSAGLDQRSGTLIVGSVDWCGTLTKAPTVYTAGNLYFGGNAKQDDASSGWVHGLDARTGAIRWKFKTVAPVVSGVTPTASGITFVGDLGGTLYAFDSAKGTVLTRVETGGAIAGGVITYKALGTQYLAVTSGNISRSTWPKASGMPTLIIYKVGDKPQPAAPTTAAIAQPSLASVAAGDPQHGRQVFGETCSGCHGAHGEGENGPRLIGVGSRLDHDALVAFIKKPQSPMPTLYPGVITDKDVQDVATYIETLK